VTPLEDLLKKKILPPVTPRQFQGDFNLSENVFIVKSNCVEDFRQDEGGGYIREINYLM
jgi:hypothetical protein